MIAPITGYVFIRNVPIAQEHPSVNVSLVISVKTVQNPTVPTIVEDMEFVFLHLVVSVLSNGPELPVMYNYVKMIAAEKVPAQMEHACVLKDTLDLHVKSLIVQMDARLKVFVTMKPSCVRAWLTTLDLIVQFLFVPISALVMDDVITQPICVNVKQDGRDLIVVFQCVFVIVLPENAFLQVFVNALQNLKELIVPNQFVTNA
jgi:hypothetical protein